MRMVNNAIRKPIPYHPFLIGVYSILALLASNMGQIRPPDALRAGLISLAGAGLVYLLLILVLRDASRAALLASFWLLLFFSYGHVYQLIEGKALLGVVVGKHRYLVGLWLLIVILGTWGVLRKIKDTATLNRALNGFSAILVLIPAAQIGLSEIRYAGARTATAASASANAPSTTPGSAPADSSSPDIYYIILDGYSRADVLQQLYGLDTRPFLDELRSIGFVIPECAQSNYGMTAFSMVATFHMNYLDAFSGIFPWGSSDRVADYTSVHDTLIHNPVRQFLAGRGYRMVSVETGYWWLDFTDADDFIIGNNNPLARYAPGYAVSSFEEMYLRTTALRVLAEANSAFLSQVNKQVVTPRQRFYEREIFALDQLEKVPELSGKKFVYFHIAAPHDPFVFDQNGAYLAQDPGAPDSGLASGHSDIPGYPDQVTYLNKRIIPLVRSLIAASKTPPIIILQADHGWDPRYRMRILNAYYLPNGGGSRVYPTITPVNTFRLIFDTYFGQHLGFLPDASYFSIGLDYPKFGITSAPYQLQPVAGSCMDR